jgi:glutamine phosphoribosylpyrophosphate amidotransferase
VHSQAPTTENSDSSSIHPARMHHSEVGDTSLLWHNGILKPNTISMLREKTGMDTTWDTQLLLQHMINSESLSEIDGTFACLMYHAGNMYMFRNEISPLFIDFDMNISSTKFEVSSITGNAFSILPNHVFKLDFYSMTSIIQSTFTTKNSPYILEL